jgi:hypothetical protein
MAQGEYISPKRQTIVDMNYTMTVVYSGPSYRVKFDSHPFRPMSNLFL